MTSNLDLIRGRQVVQTLTNKSGGAVIAGDVVIVDTANDESFTTTTTAAYTATQVGIALESIASTATGRVLLQGYAPLVNVSASATRGYYLFTHTVAKQATSSAIFTGGAFGQVLKAGTTPSAYIFPPALSASIGVTRSGATTDLHLAVWNGSNADSIKDGGVAPAGAYTQGARVYNSGNLTITSGALTALTFNSERYDTDTIHDTGSNTGRLTCNTAGKYHIFGHIQWVADPTGVRLIAIRLGGSTYIAIHSEPAVPTNTLDGATYMSIDTVYDLAGTNYVELIVGHTKGSNLDIAASGNFSPEFGMQRIG